MAETMQTISLLGNKSRLSLFEVFKMEESGYADNNLEEPHNPGHG